MVTHSVSLKLGQKGTEKKMYYTSKNRWGCTSTVVVFTVVTKVNFNLNLLCKLFSSLTCPKAPQTRGLESIVGRRDKVRDSTYCLRTDTTDSYYHLPGIRMTHGPPVQDTGDWISRDRTPRTNVHDLVLHLTNLYRHKDTDRKTTVRTPYSVFTRQRPNQSEPPRTETTSKDRRRIDSHGNDS